MASDETFRRSWTGRIVSSAGYSVRVGGRTGVDHRDEVRRLHIDSELMAHPYVQMNFETRSVPKGDWINNYHVRIKVW